MTQNAARLSSTTPNPALNDEDSSIEEGMVKNHEGGTSSSYSQSLRRNDSNGNGNGNGGNGKDNIRSMLKEGNGVLDSAPTMKTRVPLEHR